MINSKKNSEKILKPETIKKGVESVGSFSTIIYGIILASSISYNIGYFKYINPQIVDLLTLGDYIDGTVHNIWLFLFGVLLFFVSSLGFIKKKIENDAGRNLVLSLFALVVSSYFFLKGMSYNKFWPTIKMLLFKVEWMPLFITVIIFTLAIVLYIVYKFSSKIAGEEVPIHSISIVPIFIFLLVVVTPYLGGALQGYIESNYLTKNDYKIQAVSIVTLPNQVHLYDLFVIKKIDKGLVLRQFNNVEDTGGKIFFLAWGTIKEVVYKDVNKIPFDT